MFHQKVRVAIIGAGIGGLTLSAALGALQRGSESNVEVDLYESASVISEIGAGITLWPRVWKIMKAIDLGEKLERFLPRPPDNSTRLVFQVRKGDQPEGYFIHDIMMEGGSTTFHRADLNNSEVGDEIRIQFENGTTATCDLSADSPSMEPVWSGTIAYRGLVQETCWMRCFLGIALLRAYDARHCLCYSRSFINVAAFVTDPSKLGTPYDTTAMTPDEIHQSWCPYISLKEPLKWPIYQVVALKSYVSGRALYLAHGLPPHQGSGASTAIEDAYYLKIAEIYNDIRCVEGNRALEAAIGCGLEHVKEGDSNVDTEVLDALGKELSQAWSWVWKDSAEDDRIRALERLNETAGRGIETN
ncbi:salicylate hydroxylase [Pholiota molesta]|nr:salicylate hydroxylase [Pholiota molesta]